MPLNPSQPPIIDYEGSRYRTDFWEGQGREYEDLVERAAIRRLLPPSGDVILEAGAGFGRLAPLYTGYRRIVLMDYSLSLLQEARQQWGHDDRFLFVAASIYQMPFVDNLLDALVMIRVMHHLQTPALALQEFSRVLRGGKACLLEYANKRNLKAILRYALRRQEWSPFDPQPYEFVRLNYDFHPAWMAEQIQSAGFSLENQLAVSSFRIGLLKRAVPAPMLARLDAAIAGPGSALKLSPSVILRCRSQKAPATPSGFFRCPACGHNPLAEADEALTCSSCNAAWPLIDGIIDFRMDVSRETSGGTSMSFS